MTVADINSTLASLAYTPGAGFYGSATLTVSTNDNDTSGSGSGFFGGPLVDTRTASVTVAGLFENEVDLTEPAATTLTATGKSSSTANNTNDTATLTVPSGSVLPTIGQTITVSGFTGTGTTGRSNLNGTYIVVTASGTTITYKDSAGGATTAGGSGTVTFGTTSTTEFVNVFSTVPNYTIPSGVYIVGIDGQANSLSTTATGTIPTVGQVQDIVSLGGMTTGNNGYLTLLEANSPFNNSAAVNAQGETSVDTATGATGFGNGTSNSTYFGITDVHTGAGIGSLSDLEAGSASYLLIQATGSAPTIGASIDGGSTSTATVAGWFGV